jgi:toxin secretion/phage lysis holin
MENIINKANLLWGGVITILSALFGQYWFLFAGLIMFNIIDWLTGWYYAYTNHLESSKVGAKGIIKKVGYWIVILVAFFVANCFVSLGELIGVNLGFSTLIGWFVLASYLVNELRSILENAVKLGWNVPEFLVKGLEIADNAIDRAANKEGVE